MVRCVTRDENLYNLAYSELYARLFLHFNHICPFTDFDTCLRL